MPKFEAHITCPREASEIVQEVATKTGWTYSAIDGDPVMGKQAYCYLTAYDFNGHHLLESVKGVSTILKIRNIEVLREKVEQIVYDTKTGVNELTPKGE